MKNATTGRIMLLPPAKDACQVCARKHEPDQPHDAQSLYWHTARQMEGLPPPTWADALEHVTPALRAFWVAELAKHGVVVDPPAKRKPRRRRS